MTSKFHNEAATPASLNREKEPRWDKIPDMQLSLHPQLYTTYPVFHHHHHISCPLNHFKWYIFAIYACKVRLQWSDPPTDTDSDAWELISADTESTAD